MDHLNFLSFSLFFFSILKGPVDWITQFAPLKCNIALKIFLFSHKLLICHAAAGLLFNLLPYSDHCSCCHPFILQFKQPIVSLHFQIRNKWLLNITIFPCSFCCHKKKQDGRSREGSICFIVPCINIACINMMLLRLLAVKRLSCSWLSVPSNSVSFQRLIRPFSSQQTNDMFAMKNPFTCACWYQT